jgi:serine/threonine-protein kinase
MKLQPGSRPVPDSTDYVLIRRIGAGAFGEVWHAHGPGGLDVALKFIPIRNAQILATELRSLQLMTSIRHPNLVSLFGAWADDEGWLILAMEKCDGTLQDRLTEARSQKQPGIPPQELLSYMADAAKGLDALNATGQHRDIKPANLLLLGSGVKVADFGLAKALEATVASNSGSGTIAYMAPECFKGKLAQQSDQYSLAVTYFELRTGNLPFKGDQAQMMYAHLEQKPDLSSLPAAERGVLERALSKEPSKRWEDCKTFVGELSKAWHREKEDQERQQREAEAAERKRQEQNRQAQAARPVDSKAQRAAEEAAQRAAERLRERMQGAPSFGSKMAEAKILLQQAREANKAGHPETAARVYGQCANRADAAVALATNDKERAAAKKLSLAAEKASTALFRREAGNEAHRQRATTSESSPVATVVGWVSPVVILMVMIVVGYLFPSKKPSGKAMSPTTGRPNLAPVTLKGLDYPPPQFLPATEKGRENPATGREKAVAPGWYDYSSPNGKFTIQFPDKPSKQTLQNAGVEYHLVSVAAQDAYFEVSHNETLTSIDKITDQIAFVSFIAKTECGSHTITAQDNIALGVYPGRAVTADRADNEAMHVRVYLVKNRLYKITVHCKKDSAALSRTEKFFKSFKLTN